MRLGRERLTRGLLLRLGLLLVAAGLAVHVYLETRRRAAPAAGTQDGEQRAPLSSGEEEEAERRRRRRISDVRSPGRGLPAGGGAAGTSTHFGRKVTRFITWISRPHI